MVGYLKDADLAVDLPVKLFVASLCVENRIENTIHDDKHFPGFGVTNQTPWQARGCVFHQWLDSRTRFENKNCIASFVYSVVCIEYGLSYSFTVLLPCILNDAAALASYSKTTCAGLLLLNSIIEE
jgi:hypothetical protein